MAQKFAKCSGSWIRKWWLMTESNLYSRCFASANCLQIELMLLVVLEISSWPLLLLLFHRWPCNVPPCHFIEAQWPLHTRHSGQLVEILLFSVFRSHETKWRGCGCILVCFWRYCPVFVIGQNMKVWAEHCPSRVMTPCTLHCWARLSFSVLVIVVTGFILRTGNGRCSLWTGVDRICPPIVSPLLALDWRGGTNTGKLNVRRNSKFVLWYFVVFVWVQGLMLLCPRQVTQLLHFDGGLLSFQSWTFLS